MLFTILGYFFRIPPILQTKQGFTMKKILLALGLLFSTATYSENVERGEIKHSENYYADLVNKISKNNKLTEDERFWIYRIMDLEKIGIQTINALSKINENNWQTDPMFEHSTCTYSRILDEMAYAAHKLSHLEAGRYFVDSNRQARQKIKQIDQQFGLHLDVVCKKYESTLHPILTVPLP